MKDIVKIIGEHIVDTNYNFDGSINNFNVDQTIVIGADGKPHITETKTEQVKMISGSILLLQDGKPGYDHSKTLQLEHSLLGSSITLVNLITLSCLIVVVGIVFILIKNKKRRQVDDRFLSLI